MTLTMLAARDRADAFAGAPRGSAKPLSRRLPGVIVEFSRKSTLSRIEELRAGIS
jgi:hypothetical protein